MNYSSIVAKNKTKLFFLMFIMTTIIGLLGYVISATFNFGLTGTGVFLIIAGIIDFIAYWFSDVFVIKSTNAIPISLIFSEFAIYLHLVSKAPEINTSITNLIIYLVITGNIPMAIGDFIQNMISPIGLLIWGIGIWVAYSFPKAEKL